MLFIKGINIKKSDNLPDEYPYNIPLIKNFEELLFDKPVSFFVGENGTGKSTFIEAIAVACGLNAEGGSQNFRFETKASHSNLYKNIVLYKNGNLPVTKYFLRAESFYNVASEIERAVDEDKNYDMLNAHGGKSLHKCSHGEAFMQLVQNRFYDKGLYILDEPEAALSPSRLMSMLVLIDDLVKNGSQFIIATHSPILLSYPKATIFSFDTNPISQIAFKDTDHYKLTKLFIENPEMMIDRLLRSND